MIRRNQFWKSHHSLLSESYKCCFALGRSIKVVGRSSDLFLFCCLPACRGKQWLRRCAKDGCETYSSGNCPGFSPGSLLLFEPSTVQSYKEVLVCTKRFSKSSFDRRSDCLKYRGGTGKYSIDSVYRTLSIAFKNQQQPYFTTSF